LALKLRISVPAASGYSESLLLEWIMHFHSVVTGIRGFCSECLWRSMAGSRLSFPWDFEEDVTLWVDPVQALRAGTKAKGWLKGYRNQDERAESLMNELRPVYVLDTSAWWTLIEDETGADTSACVVCRVNQGAGNASC
jgi:hypothetical protein